MPKRSPMERRLIFQLLGVFFLGFVFIFGCFAGLPADFNADHPQNVISCNALTSLEYLQLILNPLTPAWFYPPQTTQMGYLRPLQFLILKTIYNHLGYDLFLIHFIEAVGFGLLNALFFYLIYRMTKSLLLSWLGVLLYMSFPSNYILNISIFPTDMQYFLSLLTLSSLICLAMMTLKPQSPKKFFLLCAGWIIFTWLAIKLKTSEKILPLIYLGFLILRGRFIFSRIGRRKVIALVLITITMGLLVVPLQPFKKWQKLPIAEQESVSELTRKDQITFSFSLKNLYQRTFHVPNRAFPLFSPLRRGFPDSFTENYGFFAGWLFWVGVLLLPLILSKLRSEKSQEMLTHGLLLIAVWFGFVIIGFGSGLTVHDKRLLNFGYVPSILLFFGAIGGVEKIYFSQDLRKWLWRGALTVIFLYTCTTNFLLFFKQLAHFGGIQHALVSAEKDVYKAVYGEEPYGMDLYERHMDLENRAVLVDWYDLSEDWFEKVQEKLSKQGKLFFYTRRMNSEKLEKFRQKGYEIELWNRYDFLDASPIFFRLLNMIASRFPRVAERFLIKEGKQMAVIVYLIKSR